MLSLSSREEKLRNWTIKNAEYAEIIDVYFEKLLHLSGVSVFKI